MAAGQKLHLKQSALHLKSESLTALPVAGQLPCLGDEWGQELGVTLSLDLSENFTTQALPLVIQDKAYNEHSQKCV